MTREEAIETLRNTAWLGTDKKVGQVEEAIQIAITALQAQDVDAVSRQAVMWMLTNLSYTQCRTQGEVEVIGLAKTLLIAMPSAQEVNNSNQEVNNSTATQSNSIKGRVDMISRQAAIDAVYKCANIFINNLPVMVDKADAYKALAELPSAQPEIIHCRECVKRQYDTLFDKYWCKGREVREDFYCGDAERRTDERMDV